MEQQHVSRAVEASTRRPVRAGSSKDDPARPHQAGQHDKDRQRQGSVLPKILETIRCHFSISNRVHDIFMPHVVLEGSCVMPIVGELVTS
jgi:hypothetical protein